LDAHFSAKRIAEPLRKGGHEVLALCEESTLDGLTDALANARLILGKRLGGGRWLGGQRLQHDEADDVIGDRPSVGAVEGDGERMGRPERQRPACS
jgi:hypothetical protein